MTQRLFQVYIFSAAQVVCLTVKCEKLPKCSEGKSFEEVATWFKYDLYTGYSWDQPVYWSEIFVSPFFLENQTYLLK